MISPLRSTPWRYKAYCMTNKKGCYRPGKMELSFYQPGKVGLSFYQPGKVELSFYRPGKMKLSFYQPGKVELSFYQPSKVELSFYQPGKVELSFYQSGKVELSFYQPRSTCITISQLVYPTSHARWSYHSINHTALVSQSLSWYILQASTSIPAGIFQTTNNTL